MARDLITPVKTSEMATIAASFDSTVNAIKVNGTNGAYVKCTGIDPTRLVFFIARNSSKCSTLGKVYVVNGSTSGNDDFTPGKYSTANNFQVIIPKSTNSVHGGTSGRFNVMFFTVPETARFLDTDQYLKFNFDADMTSATHASVGARMGAIYINKP